jgi:hypothetical protein
MICNNPEFILGVASNYLQSAAQEFPTKRSSSFCEVFYAPGPTRTQECSKDHESRMFQRTYVLKYSGHIFNYWCLIGETFLK